MERLCFTLGASSFVTGVVFLIEQKEIGIIPMSLGLITMLISGLCVCSMELQKVTPVV